MESKILLLSILLASLLLFGCLGGEQQTQQQTQTQTGNGQQGTGTGTQATGAGQQDTGPGTQDTFDPASATSYGLAIAAGVPLECTAVVNGETMKYWVKGNNMLMSGMSGGRQITAVLKDDDVYIKLNEEDKVSYSQMGLSCDWFLMKGEETGAPGTGESTGSDMTTVDTTSYTAPNVKWSCVAAVFGDEKFATPGNACTGEDLMNAMGMPPQ